MLADLWVLELTSMAWRQLRPSGPQPQPRCSHAAAAVGDAIVVFGGAFYGPSGGLQVRLLRACGRVARTPACVAHGRAPGRGACCR
jgi:hypothetical protein